MPEKTGSAKRHPAMLDAFERFFERVDDEPEYAAHLAQKISRDVPDSLGNQSWRISVCHGRETWPYLSMGKRAKFSSAKNCLESAQRASPRHFHLLDGQ